MTYLYHLLQWTWGGTPFRSGASGYNIFSGPLPDVVFISFFIQVWRKHNCHVHHCHRIAWHPDPESGHPICKRHHPDHPRGGGAKVSVS